jgi:hypothetical protein
MVWGWFLIDRPLHARRPAFLGLRTECREGASSMGDARAAVTPADPQGRKDEKLPWGSEGPRGWRSGQPAIRERHRLVERVVQ